MKLKKWKLFCGAVLVLIGVALLLKYKVASTPKSIIVVTIDTLRADRLESYGYSVNTSPNMKLLAERGVQFEWAFSTSNITAPSHASIMTGMYPRNHSIGTANLPVLDDSFYTLAEAFSAKGYQTAAVVSNAVLSRGLGLAQGFDIYDDDFTDREEVRGYAERKSANALKRAKEIVDGFSKDRPFFLWIHFQDPHGPYETNPEEIGLTTQPELTPEILPIGKDHTGYKSIPVYQVLSEIRDAQIYRQRYDAEIKTVDLALGKFIEILDGRNFFDSGYLFLTSDHGETLGENDFYFSHGNSPLPDQTRVPFIIVGPYIPRSKITKPISNASIFPTALELVNLPVIESGPEIVSVKNLITGNENAAANLPDVYVETSDTVSVVKEEGMLSMARVPNQADDYWAKANVSAGGGPILKIDPEKELSFNTTKLKPEIIEQMRQSLSKFQKEAPQKKSRSQKSANELYQSEEMIKKLRTLGYIN